MNIKRICLSNILILFLCKNTAFAAQASSFEPQTDPTPHIQRDDYVNNDNEYSGYNPLHRAIQQNRYCGVKSLLTRKINYVTDASSKIKEGKLRDFNPLQLAIYWGRVKIAKILLTHQDITQKVVKKLATEVIRDNNDWRGYNAIMLAECFGLEEVKKEIQKRT
ncbi:MAG: ankyrin repeat domain-containing protein [Bacteroidota bacterium]